MQDNQVIQAQSATIVECEELTGFGTADVRASHEVHRRTVARDGEVERDNKPPISEETWHSIDQTLEESQKREFDSHHSHPGKDQARFDQFSKFENSIEIR